MSLPQAAYTGPKSSHTFTVDPTDIKYNRTEGRTTGASEYVLNQGHEDLDKPSQPKQVDSDGSEEPKYTKLSQLRMQLTGLQDDINEYLTEKLNHVKKPRNPDQEREINELLDGADDE